MNGTIWNESIEGNVDEVYDASEEMGSPAMVIAESPDWIRYPADFLPALAEKTAQVTANERIDIICPLCGVKAPRKVLTSEHGICVLACVDCGRYAWFKKDELGKLR